MLDIRLIRENPDFVKERLATRGGEDHLKIDEILACDKERRELETRLQQLQADRKRISKEIGAAKSRGESTEEIEARVRGIGDEISTLNHEATAAEQRQRELLLWLPNLPHADAPIGKTAEENPEIKTWGEKPKFDFAPLDHVKLAENLELIDFERATKITGSGFACFTGDGARLERALINFLLDTHTREHGYREINPPFLINRDSLIGTSQLPKFEDQLYGIGRSLKDFGASIGYTVENFISMEEEAFTRDFPGFKSREQLMSAPIPSEMFLAPTAEVPVTNLYRDEILANDELPKKLVAYTPCFRSEAGAAGIGTRGLIRIHQFDKVELVKITTPETSFVELESLTANAETILQKLGLHYRIIELCTGDVGFGSTKTYDIEVWAPGQNAYLEVSSCSNFGDFQARRMNLRFKDAEGKNRFCHTLNGSGTALPRLFVALLETYQQADGSVKIPEVLQSYFGATQIG